MKLWVDDVRPAPEDYVQVKSVSEAKIHILRTDNTEINIEGDLKMTYIQPQYINFYKAVCAWNHKKNFSTLKQLFKYCAEPWAHWWEKPWFILKDTLNGRYKEIEKFYEIPLDE